jgi:hypothetical protein
MILDVPQGKETFIGWPEFDMVESVSVDLRRRSHDEYIVIA